MEVYLDQSMAAQVEVMLVTYNWLVMRSSPRLLVAMDTQHGLVEHIFMSLFLRPTYKPTQDMVSDYYLESRTGVITIFQPRLFTSFQICVDFN